LKYAQELEDSLKSPDFKLFLIDMFGDDPNSWQNNLIGTARLRLICNYFTRMRFCKLDGSLDLKYKGLIKKAPNNIIPWFNMPNRIPIQAEIIFGHWASLGGINPTPSIHAIDTGFVWGGAMTALRLQDKQRFTINWDAK
jgi:bis(5'-nucleosyl)-tetraphosphatase (symmetrical)